MLLSLLKKNHSSPPGLRRTSEKLLLLVTRAQKPLSEIMWRIEQGKVVDRKFGEGR